MAKINNRVPTISCVVRPSKILLMINLMFYCALLFWWLHVTANLLPLFLGAGGLVFLLGYTLWRYILLASPQSWIGFEAKDTPNWSIVSRQGKIYEALLRPDSLIFPGMITLRFNVGELLKPVSITLFKDSLLPDDWRRLRVLLNWTVSKPR